MLTSSCAVLGFIIRSSPILTTYTHMSETHDFMRARGEGSGIDARKGDEWYVAIAEQDLHRPDFAKTLITCVDLVRQMGGGQPDAARLPKLAELDSVIDKWNSKEQAQHGPFQGDGVRIDGATYRAGFTGIRVWAYRRDKDGPLDIIRIDRIKTIQERQQEEKPSN
jgi:hypothetical protein